MNRLKVGLVVGAVIVAGLAAATAFYVLRRPESATAAESETEARKPLYWYDPMVPAQHFDQPGKSPFMDMQLVPKYADDAAGGDDASTLRIDPRVAQNLGVRLAKAQLGPFAREVRAVGVVAVDEHRIEAVQVRAAGWVEQLSVRAVGDKVRRGQRLAAVYAPELLAAQQEFLLAQRSGDEGLRSAARARLSLFGLTEAQIARVAATGDAERRVEYVAPFDGYVMELGARQGGAVQPGMMLFQLASLATVWLEVEVPEAQAAWLKTGDRAQADVTAWPGEHFNGRVDYVYPELNSTTRTLKLRLVFDNAGGRLRPGMYGTVQLRAAPREHVLTVPSEAVIKTGQRSVVLIADDLSRYRPIVVRTGAEANDRIEILEGLKDGDEVVASGQFLIDSEASLRGALDRIGGENAEAPQ